MKSVIILRADGEPIYLHEDGMVSWMGELAVDADGSPRAYHPGGSPPGLDYLANAGKPGNWWGLATDDHGRPIVQAANDPAHGFYVSTTAYKNPGFAQGDPRRELDSGHVRFVVVPSTLIPSVAPVVLGCKAIVVDTRTGRSIHAMVGDIGPRNHLGEVSMLAAAAMGFSADPKQGGSSLKRFHYMIWPGAAAPGYRLQASNARAAALAMTALGDLDYV